MRSIHQAVAAGWTQQVRALYDFYVPVAVGNPLGRYLSDQFTHALQASLRPRPRFAGCVDGGDDQNRSLGVLRAHRFQKWSVDLGERLDRRIILGEVHHEAGSVDTRDGIRQFRLAHPITRKSEIDEVDVEHAPE